MNVFELIEKHGIELHGEIEYFAELVRADEREQCALIVEHKQVPLNWNDRECFAKAIRARGEK